MSDIETEVTAWFFDDYLPTWIGVGNGTIGRGTEFILDYWGAPLSWSGPTASGWSLDGPAVIDFLEATHNRLKDNGYTTTVVPDRTVRVYHRGGAAIEVIWSRRRADDTEIERVAVHFEVNRTADGWRVVGIQQVFTDADTLADAWDPR